MMPQAPQESQTSTSRKTDWISVAALIVAAVSLVLAAGAVIFSVKTEIEKGNADLVKIGVSVLRVDPEKEKQISEATREWALNLIDANAGGVTFSPEARAQLLRKPLSYNWGGDSGWGTYYDDPGNTPLPRRPAPEPPK